ncbi:MAG TPA: N,N-dimethylformamidase beta subunit family domain-containing protein, partial [Bryobacteraceae bacterium]
MDVYRLGWYSGTGARQMVATIPRTGVLQTTPTADSFGRFECNWTSPYVLAIPANWVSGIYLVKLTASTGPQSYIQFVVREDSRASAYLFQHSVTTDAAYNNWPGPAAGGKSLYTFNSGGVAAVKVSFNRPYYIDTDSHYFSHVGAGFLLRWEVMMLRWLESKGYDVTYCTNIDTHETASLLLNHKAFLSVGHDEYWSWEMRANVEAARDQGVNLAFFSADACYWQIRLETSPISGAIDRTIVGYKEKAQAGLYGSTVTNDPTTDRCRITTNWRFNACKPSEQAFIGIEFIEGSVGCPSTGTCVDMVIADGSSWALAGSGLTTGSHIPGILGYEVDGQLTANSPAGTQVIAKSPIPILDGDAQNHPFSEMVTYTAASGATVFSVGTFQWTWGLDDFGAAAQRPSQLSPAVQKITQNVLSRFAPAATAPDLTITKSHTGNFTPGQTGATYTITVTNSGGAATGGTVTVTDTVPAGLTATSIAGTGWTCTQPAGSCTRNDVLAAAASYPPLTLTVNVAANAPASVTNAASVSGGGETNTANDTASDATTIGAAASAPVTDNFNTSSLNTSLWTLVNPVGDGSFAMTGTQLKLNAPAASNHDPAFGGADNSVRVVQSIANADFQATVKFDSIPSQQYQFEGILVEQDAANYLRFQFASSATSLHVAASQILSHNETIVVDNAITLPAGTASLWLRIQRTGNTWTETWSTDGANFSPAGSFTLALTTTDIGPFAGNYNPTASASPALSALVDSFVSGTVAAAPVLTISKSHTGNFTPGQTGAAYTLNVTNSGTASSSGTVTVTDTLPGGLTATSIAGSGWICTQPAGPCTRSDVLAAATAYPPLTLTVNVASNAPATVTNTATVSGGGSASPNSASDPATVGVSADPTSDDFRSLTLSSGIWTYINPLGGSYSLTGTNLLISVQGGVSHDPLASTGNSSSRVMQSMRNVDFSAEIKFDSVPTQPGTMQGILVQQDATNFLRFEFQGTGGGTNIFAGTVIGNSPSTISNSAIAATGASLWMRVARTGSTWTLTWSRDGASYQSGASFTQALTVSAIGPMVGNYGSSGRLTPDFTASIDYFFNLASPVVPQDGGSPRIFNIRSTSGAASAVVTWNTDENANSRVDFGPTTSYGSTKSDPAMATAHSVLLTGLTCAATLNYSVTSVDAGSATRQSSNLTFTTPPCASPSAPRSDSFDSASLNATAWTWIDPNSNSYIAFNGTTAQITVPSNSVHNPLSPAGNGSARIVQPVLDTNFDVAAKFVSEPVWGTTGQGILVEQDALNYLLFELRSEGANAGLWAGSRAGAGQNVFINAPFPGHAPVWLRVTRSGATWTLSWSVDGNTYTPAGTFQQSLAVASLGLYAANNAATPVGTPAFTASVDAFVNINTPLPNNSAPPPFSRIVIDPDPGTVLVQETMGDLDGDGRPDAVVGFSDPSHGLAWYRSPHSGVLTDKWDRFVITPNGESYEDVIVYDVNGDGAKDVIASIDSAIKWYENPAGHGGNPTTGVWQEHIVS